MWKAWFPDPFLGVLVVEGMFKFCKEVWFIPNIAIYILDVNVANR